MLFFHFICRALCPRARGEELEDLTMLADCLAEADEKGFRKLMHCVWNIVEDLHLERDQRERAIDVTTLASPVGRPAPRPNWQSRKKTSEVIHMKKAAEVPPPDPPLVPVRAVKHAKKAAEVPPPVRPPSAPAQTGMRTKKVAEVPPPVNTMVLSSITVSNKTFAVGKKTMDPLLAVLPPPENVVTNK
jgi:hypothetical protein